ncbi:MocR-like pyridoxine biosynthesis transcription factor PdxR [Cohnella herbarum]|uniref:PLP-dependent aminotransferase family protein n=1 Tax=Cohnella herbarum TaxID=2728023 RepID=A0A7Z2VMF0_9BACL|nr:PLP-dependent aminotransferase family protein [Cohnella herbarum]QJD85515.1 PLP-dependent aminotransferase family protein [Cohnella herbarum]
MTWITMDRASGTPLFRQIYAHFRKAILQGEMKSGTALPSTRELASALHVSRNVVVEAYEQLFAEGYIESRHGSGTYVADGTFLDLARHALPSIPLAAMTSSVGTAHADLIDFRHGIPALNQFPRKLWGQLAQRICADTSDEAFGYGKPEGSTELRAVLAQYLLRTRGVICEPEQLIITTGATQAINLIAKLLLPGGKEIIIEDPITKEIHTLFSLPGTTLSPVPADDQGMMTHLLPTDGKPCFIYVTPSHQFPLGGVLPIQRRVQLIQYASASDCYIVEDDYDSEFRYEGAPVSSLQGLDPDRVIYIGTFSKILSPALRMGYLILPRSLVETARGLKWLTDLHTPSLEQLILARFIEGGYLDRHVAKMKKLYRKRRDYLIQALVHTFADKVTILGYSTGLHLVAEFTGAVFTPALLAQIEQSGVRVYPVSVHALDKNKHRKRIILGYGNLSEERIAEGIRRLGSIMQ